MIGLYHTWNTRGTVKWSASNQSVITLDPFSLSFPSSTYIHSTLEGPRSLRFDLAIPIVRVSPPRPPSFFASQLPNKADQGGNDSLCPARSSLTFLSLILANYSLIFFSAFGPFVLGVLYLAVAQVRPRI